VRSFNDIEGELDELLEVQKDTQGFMAIHADMLEQARRFHQAGQLPEAERADF
jgi:hypothetical protein